MPMPSLQERLALLCQEKARQTKEKQEIRGYMDYDDHAIILPPPHLRKITEAISSSGVPIRDVLLNNFEPVSNHADGSFYGFTGCGMNFKRLLEVHPPYIDKMSALAGGYMVNFMSYRKSGWNPDYPFNHLHALQRKYQLGTGIGAAQHFCQEMSIGLELGYDGLLAKIAQYRNVNQEPEKQEFYDGLTYVIEGLIAWIENNAKEALRLAELEPDEEIRQSLIELYEMNMRVAHKSPQSFREAAQFTLYFTMAARMYNGSGSLGRLDVILQPYYEKDTAAGRLTEEEAIFILACQLLRDTVYLHLGGYHADGSDTTSKVTFLILEAIHRLKIPSNAGVCVGKGISRDLLRKSVEIQFADKCGNPRFVGVDALVDGMMKSGYSIEDARMRTNSGCHWLAIPGREYSIMDCVKLNFGVVFDIALREAVQTYGEVSVEQIFDIYKKHIEIAVRTLAAGFDVQFDHMKDTLPELVLDLLCYGTIEKGLDASNGGVEFYSFCIDGCALAVVADSFAAIQKRIIEEKRYTFAQLIEFLDENWQSQQGQIARAFFSNCDRYGKGGSFADEMAAALSKVFADTVHKERTPKHGHNMIAGLFSWASTIGMGAHLGATPNGRYRGAPISHGANPNPGFRQDGAATAMSNAIAAVQCGYGNSCPMQIELEPGVTAEQGGAELVMALIEDHFAKGGTLINLNVIDADRIIQAHKVPDQYPDLVVRVTGFSAYFASLSPEFRQLVVDRILDKSMN